MTMRKTNLDSLKDWDNTPSKKVIKKVIEQEVKIEETSKIKAKSIWDIRIGEDINFFDPSLSYEITKYRPITMTQGLDFNVDAFIEDGETYKRTGKYCSYPRGSKAFMDWWRERHTRCKNGFTHNGYTITGDHYFFLNFYRLPNVRSFDDGGDPENFPNFYSKQYEYFHYIALCEYLKKDACALKARGVGFSEIAACLGVAPYTVTPKFRSMYSAYSEDLIKPTMEKCWEQLNFLNQHTDGGMKRVRQHKNTDLWKRASKLDKERNESGHMAEIEGKVADKARKLRGARCRRLFFEEAGSDPILVTKYNQAKALVTIIGKRIGIRIVWGTGGDSGPALAGLSSIFYNPEDFDVLPVKNNYNDKGEYVFTGMFIAAYSLVEEFTDERGVTDEVVARADFETQRKQKSSDPRNLLEFKSEYCFTPEEALIKEGGNEFDSIALSEQMTNIELHKNVILPKFGFLRWPMDTSTGKQNRHALPQWETNQNGKMAILEHPIKDEHGESYKNLYVGGIDSIDADKSTSTGQKDVSDFCIIIKRRQFGIQEPTIVAVYKDRPDDVRDAYNNALKLLQYYDCKAVIEASRVGIVTHFKNVKQINYLMRRPRATMSNIESGNSSMFGVPATPNVIAHYKELIGYFIADYCHTIAFKEVIEQGLKYSDQMKKKFDIIAAWGMCELGDEELHAYLPRVKNNISKTWKNDIGYYTDEYGRKRWGKIPNKNNTKRVQYQWTHKS